MMLLSRLLIVCIASVTFAPVHAAVADKNKAVAIFAGGCFWCMEPPFDKLQGVESTTSGYIGGSAKSAEYKKVSAGGTGHYEAVQIVYNPAKVSYQELLDVYWVNVDPFDAKGQFCDKGQQYLSAILYVNDDQRALAEASLAKVKQELQQQSDQPIAIATAIKAAGTFYPAEDYHQDYYQKNPLRYKFYRTSCGRDRRLEDVWGER